MSSTDRNAEEITKQADDLKLKKKWREAFDLYRKAAEDGYAQAQCALGYCYLNGLGCNHDNIKAMEWYTRAAEQGNMLAQYNLGYCYQNGQGCSKDYDKAMEWYTKAAGQGNAAAQHILGDCYENGYGCPLDMDKAREWYTKAANQGFSPAMKRLEKLNSKKTTVEIKEADDLRWKGNWREAFTRYLKAAEDGNAQAQCRLGGCYLRGQGCDQDYTKAMEWYESAARQGNMQAQYSLGYCYEYGQACGRDYTKAIEWYTKAAEQGFNPAKMRLDNLKSAMKEYGKKIVIEDAAAQNPDVSTDKNTSHAENSAIMAKSLHTGNQEFPKEEEFHNSKTLSRQNREEFPKADNRVKLQGSEITSEEKNCKKPTTEPIDVCQDVPDADEPVSNSLKTTQGTNENKKAELKKAESETASDNKKDGEPGNPSSVLSMDGFHERGQEKKRIQQGEGERRGTTFERGIFSQASSARVHVKNIPPSTGKWIKILSLWLAVLMLVGLAAGCVLWHYAEAYEESRPEPVMDEILAAWSETDLITAAAGNNSFTISEFENGEQLYSDYIHSLKLTGSLRYQKELGQSASDTMVFSVRDGTARICNVVLEQDENLPFHMHTWKFGFVTTPDISKILNSTRVKIIGHEGLPVFINGKQATAENCEVIEESFRDLNPIEQKQPVKPMALVYRLESVYGEIRVEDGEGRLVLPSEENGEFVFDAVASQDYFVNIFTSDDIRILVNDYELTEEDLTGIDYTTAEKLKDCTDISYYGKENYSFRQFHSPPSVKAYDTNGAELEPIVTADGALNYYTNDSELENTATDAVRKFFNIYTEYCSHRYNDTNYLRLKRYTLTGSPFHEYIAQTYDTMSWATRTETIYKELNISNFRSLSDSCFRCTLQYSADVLSQDSHTEDIIDTQNALELIFVKKDGKWLAANMTVI